LKLKRTLKPEELDALDLDLTDHTTRLDMLQKEYAQLEEYYLKVIDKLD